VHEGYTSKKITHDVYYHSRSRPRCGRPFSTTFTLSPTSSVRALVTYVTLTLMSFVSAFVAFTFPSMAFVRDLVALAPPSTSRTMLATRCTTSKVLDSVIRHSSCVSLSSCSNAFSTLVLPSTSSETLPCHDQPRGRRENGSTHPFSFPSSS